MTWTVRHYKDLEYIEFYAGVGGWTMALDEALRSIAKTDESTVTTFLTLCLALVTLILSGSLSTQSQQ
jgi:hypothetical protein